MALSGVGPWGQIIIPSGIIPNAAGVSHRIIFGPSPHLCFIFSLVSHWQRQMVKQKLAAFSLSRLCVNAEITPHISFMDERVRTTQPAQCIYIGRFHTSQRTSGANPRCQCREKSGHNVERLNVSMWRV